MNVLTRLFFDARRPPTLLQPAHRTRARPRHGPGGSLAAVVSSRRSAKTNAVH